MEPFFNDDKGHVWKLDKNGEVDDVAFDEWGHYGPVCIKCGYGFCVSCYDTAELPVCEKMEEK